MKDYSDLLLDTICSVLSHIDDPVLRYDPRVVSCIEVSVRLALSLPQGAPLVLSRYQKCFKLKRSEFRQVVKAMSKVGTMVTYFTLK